MTMRSSTPPTDVYAAIADNTRRDMLIRLARDGEHSVNQLHEPFSISQPAISKHLRILKEAGLVRSRKDGRKRLYAIEPRKLKEVFDWVAFFEQFWDDKLDSLGAYLNKQNKNKP